MYKVIAIPALESVPLADLKTVIQDGYSPFLSMIRCGHSKQQEPCPGVKGDWEAVLDGDVVDQDQLFVALVSAQGLFEAHFEEFIQSDAEASGVIRLFLNTLLACGVSDDGQETIHAFLSKWEGQ